MLDQGSLIMVPAISSRFKSYLQPGCKLRNHRDGYHLGSFTLTWLDLTWLTIIHSSPSQHLHISFPHSYVLASVWTSCSLSCTSLSSFPQAITLIFFQIFQHFAVINHKSSKTCRMFVLLPISQTSPTFCLPSTASPILINNSYPHILIVTKTP